MAVTQIDGARQLRFTGNLDMTTNKIVNLTDPTANQDAATKAYVDAQVAGGVIDFKESVRVATTAAGTLSTDFENGDTVDGITLATNDRILIKNQGTASENGIYTVNASGAPTRASDADVSAEVTPGMFCFVEEGTSNQKTGWLLTTTGTIVLDTTSLTFEKFSEVGQLLDDLVAGDGLTKTNETVDVVANSTGGLTANANDITIKLDTDSGLQLGSGGLSIGAGSGLVSTGGTMNIVAATSGGLTINADDMEIDLDTDSGLQLGVNGLSVGDGDGLTASGGTLAVGASDGITVNANDVAVNLDGSTLSVSGTGLKLAQGTSAYLLVGQGASDTTYNAVGGDVTMSSSAAFTIADSYVTDTWVYREAPSGLINGSNTSYTLAATPITGTECVHLNGVLQNVGGSNDYTISTNTITFGSAPESGDVILVNYAK